ncbi:MAG: PEP-CTERM-box response regulator transcription factor [Deltaproteobacteria bacterium]|nr:PEP-CTERM-box response regulator transcription factor [Deltaproteobacteria bacterium]
MEILLTVEDNEEIQKQLKWGLGKDYKILLAGNVSEALSLFESHQPKVVTLDLGLPPDAEGSIEGFRCLEAIMQQAPQTKVIMLTGNEERESALRAIRMGAYDYYPKPINLDELKVILSRAFNLGKLEEENRQLHSALSEEGMELQGIFGQCPKMVEVFTTINKVSSSDAPVLILGESGTGKEMVASAIHQKSQRKNGSFIPINCGAIPENLLESELFGHEKGSFTGAHGRVQGKFEFAHGGTLFLDEIGEMPLSLQVKVLRFLQEKVIQRVGGRDNIDVDARIISATNIDTQQAIEEGKFREDLFYRIGVVKINLPPLRERGKDILFLAHLFLRRFSEALNKRVRSFSMAALNRLEEYSWPGNVRELENRVKRAVIMAESTIIEPGDLDFVTVERTNEPSQVEKDSKILTLKEAKERVEKEMVVAALEKQKGNVVKAAELLGVSRPTLYDLMKKHGLHQP